MSPLAGARITTMRIMIDGMNLSLEQGTGVATYARNLVACMRREGRHVSVLYGRNVSVHRNLLLREVAFFNAVENRGRSRARILWDTLRALAPLKPYAVPQTGAVLRQELGNRLPAANSLLNQKSVFQIALSKFEAGLGMLEIVPPEPVDIAHWTYPMPLRVRGARNVYTLHDLVPLKMPYATLDQKSRYYRLVRAIAREADAIATVSEASRTDILSMLPADAARVSVTHQSVSIPSALLDTPESDLAGQLAGLAGGLRTDRKPRATLKPRGFFLFVGAVEPKKNLRRLIEAHLAANIDEPLVVVGKQAWQFEEVLRMMERAPAIHYLDYLPFSQVVMLMRTARAVVFPSLYEGFGLPVLEAFLCDTPVITADVGATAEVAGDAALLVDPYDVRSIRDALRRLSASGDPARELGATLATRGRVRAQFFEEAAIARRLAAFHDGVAAAPPRPRPAREATGSR